MKFGWEGYVDFIAIDFDKYDVWDVFMRPVPVKTQMYVKTANWDPTGPAEEVDCPPDSDPNDVCYADGQQTQQGIGQASPSFGGGGSDPATGYQEPGTEPSDGFGQGSLTEEQQKCAAGQIEDRKRNEAAKTIASDIDKKIAEDGRSGTDQPEYAATIAIDSNGNAHQGEIAQGESYDEAAPNAPQSQSRRPTGFAWSDVVATVHSHPSSGQIAVDRRNRAPSNGDWLGADEIIKRGVDPNNFTLFIIAKWGTMRAYGYMTPSERNATTSNPSGNQASPNDAVDLDDVRECNS